MTVDLVNELITGDVDDSDYGNGQVRDEQEHVVTTDGKDGFGVRGQDTTFEGTIQSADETVNVLKSGAGELTLGSAATGKGGINVKGDLNVGDGGVTLQGNADKGNKAGALVFSYAADDTTENNGLTLTNDADITVNDIREEGGKPGEKKGGDVTLNEGSVLTFDNAAGVGETTLSDTRFHAGKDAEGNAAGGEIVVKGKGGSNLTFDGKGNDLQAVDGVDVTVTEGGKVTLAGGADIKDSDITLSGSRTGEDPEQKVGSTLAVTGDGSSITGDGNITVKDGAELALEHVANPSAGADPSLDTTGSLKVDEGGSVTLNNTNNSVGGITGSGTLKGGEGDKLTVNGDGTFKGTLEGQGGKGATFTVDKGGKLTLDDVKTGKDGLWSLAVTDGSTLELDSTDGNKMEFGDITLNAGGTLALHGDNVGGHVTVVDDPEGVKKGKLTVDLAGMTPDGDIGLGDLTFDRNELDGLGVGFTGLGADHYNGALVEKGGKWVVQASQVADNPNLRPGMHKNALAGAKMMWDATAPGTKAFSYIYGDPNSDLFKVALNLGAMAPGADKDRMYAAVAGSSIATLGSASMQDLQRQLESMRNRSTLLGEAKVNAEPGELSMHAWINAESGYHKVDADGMAPGYTLNGWGGTLGGSMEISAGTTVGLAITAMYNDLKTDGADSGKGDLDATYLSGFFRSQSGAWSHTFLASVGLSDISLDRTVNGLYKTHGETDGYAAGVMYEVAYTSMLNEEGTLAFQPLFNVQYRHSKVDGYSETGSDAGLRVDEVSADVVTFGLGARMQAAISENAFGRSSVFEARVIAKADAGDNVGTATNALLNGGAAQEVESAEVGKFGIEVGAGLTLPIGSDGGTLFLDGSAEFRSGYTNLNASAGYRISF